MVTLDDGRLVVLEGEEVGSERLGYGYALTVHRSQGLTTGTCHHLADGGGRELAYVAMSRARESTTVHLVADDVDQAVEDLHREWGRDTRARWAIDTGTPGEHHPPRTMLFSSQAAGLVGAQARLTRLRAEHDALLAAIPADLSVDLRSIGLQMGPVRDQLEDLRHGRYQGDDPRLAEAAQRLWQASTERSAAEDHLRSGQLGWRGRRHWQSELTRSVEAETGARAGWDTAASPEMERLHAALKELERRGSELSTRERSRSDWLDQHPEAFERLSLLSKQIATERRQAQAAASAVRPARPQLATTRQPQATRPLDPGPEPARSRPAVEL
jgi:hypothetical protein